MKLYCVVDSKGELLQDTMYSSRERAELNLGELTEADGYFIEDRDVSDERYFAVLAAEAQEDDDTERFRPGSER
jgi:hypothetical protein